MIEAAAPQPVPTEAAKAGVNADPTQFNAQQAMDQWATPAARDERAKQAEELLKGIEGEQSSLPRRGSRITRVVPDSEVLHDGSVEHLNKNHVNSVARKIEKLYDFAAAQARIGKLKSTLTDAAHGKANISGSEARTLKEELNDLSAQSREHIKNGNVFETAPTAGTHAEGHKTPNTFDKPPVNGTRGEGVTPTPNSSFNPPTEGSRVSDAPERSARKARTFLDAQGRPLAGFADRAAADGTPIQGLDSILAERVALGDESDWNNLVQTMRDIVKNDANNRHTHDKTIDPRERIATFEKYARGKYKELKANQDGSHIPGVEVPGGEVIIMPAELQKNLDDAREAYIKISSRRRMISIGQKGKVADAKKAYDKARDAAGSHIAAQYEAAGVSPAEIKARSNAGGALELMDLANMTNNHQNEIADGKSLRRFNEFWARNGGRNQETGKRNWAGMAKKAAAMAIITAIPGAGIAFVAGTLIGAGTGALVGSALASSISRNLFRSHVEKGANAKTVAAEQAAYLIANNADNLDKSEANLDSASVSDIYQAQTDKINTRNKVRHVGAVAMGALSAVGGYYGTRAVIGAGRNLLGGGVKGHLTGPLKPATPSQIPGPTGPRIPTVPTNPTGSRIPTIPTGEIVPPVPAPTGNTLDIPKDLIDTSKWKLPWNWGQEKFGSQAANKLYSLSDQAKLDGHAVEWIRKGTNTARLFIDGKDNTAYVVNVLNHYNG